MKRTIYCHKLCASLSSEVHYIDDEEEIQLGSSSSSFSTQQQQQEQQNTSSFSSSNNNDNNNKITINNVKWLNLGYAYDRSRNIKCCICGLPGATFGCEVEDCQRSYHLPCSFAGNALLWKPYFNSDDNSTIIMSKFYYDHGLINTDNNNNNNNKNAVPVVIPPRQLQHDSVTKEVDVQIVDEEDGVVARVKCGTCYNRILKLRSMVKSHNLKDQEEEKEQQELRSNQSGEVTKDKKKKNKENKKSKKAKKANTTSTTTTK